ncbi:MAG: hypothetical protein LBQ98_08755 [Nitrososphaerota archaeon]|nr:hypothetical protein [Nitrososphaerota archaeon]
MNTNTSGNVLRHIHFHGLKNISKPIAIGLSALLIISMMLVLVVHSTMGATTTVLNISSGQWICQAHTNVEPITTYNIPHTEGTRSASGVPNLDNCYLPQEIFRGYNRWDANGGYFNLQSYPILSFDFWADKVMQLNIGIVDTTNGKWNPAGVNIADTYHNGEADTPPYNTLYGTSTVKSSDGYWLLMVGPSDKSTTHYTIDLRTLGVSLAHIGQIVFDVTANHQTNVNWKITNLTVSTNAVTPTQLPITPIPTATFAPTATVPPKPSVAPTATVPPNLSVAPTATVPPNSSVEPTPTQSATPVPTTTPTETLIATPEPTPVPTPHTYQPPTHTPAPTHTPTSKSTTTTKSPISNAPTSAVTPKPASVNPIVPPIHSFAPNNRCWGWNMFNWFHHTSWRHHF